MSGAGAGVTEEFERGSPGGPLGRWYMAVPELAPADLPGGVLLHETDEGFVTLGTVGPAMTLFLSCHAMRPPGLPDGACQVRWIGGSGHELRLAMRGTGEGSFAGGIAAASDPWDTLSRIVARASTLFVYAGEKGAESHLPPIPRELLEDFRDANGV